MSRGNGGYACPAQSVRVGLSADPPDGRDSLIADHAGLLRDQLCSVLHSAEVQQRTPAASD